MENPRITRSGRLVPEQRMGNEMHNMPEEGDEGLKNEYSSNLPEARKEPDPVSTKDVQVKYDEGLREAKKDPDTDIPYNAI